ncbi:minor capsid protein [Streptococcus hyointestinalis]|uniref:minor capsid protein n=1 Tax=Streptococcus hyointestinalis TaxID=1337 RepID=UPI003516BCEA
MTDYWRKRIEKEQLAQKERDAQLGKEMSRLYQSHFVDVTKEVKGFLERYADKNGLSYTEAMKRVEQFDVVTFQDKAKRYVETRDFSPQANRELALYNLKMKMNRLELLKANLTLALATLESDEMRLTNRFLNEEVIQTLKQQAGLLGRSVASQGNLQAVAQARINTPFEGATWSRRIWHRQAYLRQQVDAFTQDLVVRGVNPTTAIRKLRLTFDVTAHQAKRLAVTEGARVQTEVQREMLKRAGFEMVEYITEPNACPICGPHGDKHYRIDQLVPGLNAPPMHPFCRCSIAAWEDTQGLNNKLEDKMEHEQAVNISPKKTKNLFSVDRNLVNSKTFHDKFENLPFSKNVNENLYKSGLKILEHRDGTNVEDLYILDARTGEEITKNISAQQGYKVGLNNAQYTKVLDNESIVILHNHPEGGRLSYADIKTLFETPNAKGSVVVGHDGSVFVAHSPNRNISIAEIYGKLYNGYVREYQNKDIAKLRATDRLYEMGIFSHEKK